MSQDNPIPEKYEVEIFFIEGFSPRFYGALKKFCHYVYAKHNGFSDYQTFQASAIARVEDRLSQGMYDLTKSKLSWYIYKLIWNQLSYESYHTKKIRYLEDMSEVADCADVFNISESRESYLTRCYSLGIKLNSKIFIGNLEKEILSPLVLSYLWLLKRGVI